MVTTPDVLSKGKSGTRNLVKSSNSGIDMVQDATVYTSKNDIYPTSTMIFSNNKKGLEGKHSIFQITYVGMER